MSDAAFLSLRQRREEAGLSENLLNHAETGQNFLGFISYRRRDGLAMARWLRDRITNFNPPPELRTKIAKMDAEVGGKQNRVFFDMSYQKPNVDFWDEHIAASLCRSRTLILLQTPSVFERLDDGEANWCEREIETFLKYYGDPSRILVVMAPNAPIDRFPAPLEKISARWDWVDLRFFSESTWSRFRHGNHYDPLLSKILAKIYDISDGDLPLLNREFEKGRARVRRALTMAAGAAFVSLSGLTTWAFIERNKAAEAEKIAIRERDSAIVQRNAALVAQSRFLAKTADGFSADGSARAAIAILREALPDPADNRIRPLVDEAVSSAYKALYGNREIERVTLPEGTTAIASDGKAGQIIFATKDRLIVRSGLAPADVHNWPHDFGAVSSLLLSPSGDRIVMIGASGAVMVRDLATNQLVLRLAGEGGGTRAYFLQGGARLLIADAAQKKLSLFNMADGSKGASRILDIDGPAPVVSLVEGEMVALVGNHLLRRLSLDNLADEATYGISDADEYAMALSADGKTLYVAAAKEFLTGRILVLDAATLALQREFGRITWGAKALVKSKDHNFLALSGSSGVDFYDTDKFDFIGRLPTVPLTGGQFIKDSTYYIGYNNYGTIKQIQPETLNDIASFLTIDGGAITRIDALPDETGFLSISDHPSITHWAYYVGQIAKTLAIPWRLKNLDPKRPAPIHASDFLQTSNSVVAAYDNMGISRWDLEKGSAKLIRSANVPVAPRESVITLANGVTLVAQDPGNIQLYTDAGGSERPANEVRIDPPKYIGAVAPTKAFFSTKAGEASLLDVAAPDQPIVTKLPKLGLCPRSASVFNFVLCLKADGQFQGLRISDDKIVLDIPSPAEGLSSATIANDGTAVLIADKKGGLVLYTFAEDAKTKSWVLTASLKGAALGRAAANNSLSKDDVAAVVAGATAIDVKVAAEQLRLSSDQSLIAAALPNGSIKLVNTVSNDIVDIAPQEGRKIAAMRFSAHNQMLGVIDYVEDPVYRRSRLLVYNVRTGAKMFSLNADPETVPDLFAVSDGRAFVTISPKGQITLYPAFDEPQDLVAYMRQKFPDRLNPANRHSFFIE